jgi:ankyrin repeat protein
LVDFNASNAQGESILHIASRKGNEELVKYCLTLGIDPFMKNRRGKIPFEVAKRPEIKQLLKQGNQD